jgi:peptide/nickel transport system substrate-binding protein
MTTSRFKLGIAAILLASATAFPSFALAENVVRVGTVRSGAFGPIEVHRSVGDYATQVVNQGAVFEGLVGVSPKGGTHLVLAEDIVPEDQTAKSWLIKIRHGVKFQDGKELDSADVVWSIQRMTRQGMIPAGMVGPIEKVEAVDKYTIRLVLPKPKSWVVDSLSDPYAAIVENGYEAGKPPIGTGPMKVAGLQTQQSITLEKFDGYHGKPAAADKVVVQFFSESQAGLNALKYKQIDMLMDFDPALAGEAEGDKTLKLYNSPTGMAYPIQMRADVAPFNDPRLREALRLVVDREMVVNNAYNGYATVANDLYARADPNFRTDLQRQRNVEAAKKLIEEAGLSGTTLTLVTMGDPAQALVLAENAKEIGVTIEVKQLDSASFYNEEYMQRPFFGGDYWPPMSFLQTSSMVDAPNASFGQIRWKDAEYFKTWEVANATLDPAVQKQALDELQKILFDRGAWIVSAYPNELILMDASLEGLPDSDIWGRTGYRHLADLHKAPAQ